MVERGRGVGVVERGRGVRVAQRGGIWGGREREIM